MVIALIAIGGSLLASGENRGRTDGTATASSGPRPTSTWELLTLPTATPSPTAVPPLSGPHEGMPLTVELAYFHIAPDTNEPAALLADRAQFVTLTHGDEPFREQLREAGYDGRILQFLVASEVNGPGPYSSASEPCDDAFVPLRNGIARGRGEFCREIHPNEDWFLHNGAGERLYHIIGDTGVWYHMNPASEGWRDYALRGIQTDAVGPAALGFDGVLLDNVELSLVKVHKQLTNSDGIVREYGSENSYRAAWISYLEMISDALRPEVELWANMTADPNTGQSWQPYLDSLDGAMFPAFATGYGGLTPARWQNNLVQAENALEAGKGVVAVGLGDKSDRVQQQFALGSYLLIVQAGESWFRYVSSERRDELNSFWMYPNYDVTLGEPQGQRYQVGELWRRDFRCGYALVDPLTASAEVVQTECVAPG